MFGKKNEIVDIERLNKKQDDDRTTMHEISMAVFSMQEKIKRLEEAANIKRLKFSSFAGLMGADTYQIPVSDALEALMTHLGVSIHKSESVSRLTINKLNTVKIRKPPNSKKSKKK